jgi:hypothetical protein
VPHAFFGSWAVKVDVVDPFTEHSFVIAESDNADGRYIVPFLGPSPQLTVRGERWTVRIEYRRFETSQWLQAESFPPIPEGGERRTSFVNPNRGLVMHVGTGSLAHETLPKGAFQFSGMRLELTPEDPDLNPGPMPPPPGFTIPRGPD